MFGDQRKIVVCMPRYKFPKGDKNPAKRLKVREKIKLSKLRELNPMWIERVSSSCDFCGMVIEVKINELEQHHYCSKQCGRNAMSKRMKENNPMFNPIVAEKAKKTLEKHIKSGEVIPWMSTEEGRKIISTIARNRALSDENPAKKNKGRTWEEVCGIDEAIKRRKQSSERVLGKNNPMFGKHPRYPTPYSVQGLNHKVRSSWEEKFCLWLREHNITYEYEPKKFPVSVEGKVINYWVDVKLSEQAYCEIKASFFLNISFGKLKAFAKQHNKKLLIITDAEPKHAKNIEFVPFDEKAWADVFL